jgi:hypothetical protein
MWGEVTLSTQGSEVIKVSVNLVNAIAALSFECDLIGPLFIALIQA